MADGSVWESTANWLLGLVFAGLGAVGASFTYRLRYRLKAPERRQDPERRLRAWAELLDQTYSKLAWLAVLA
jgi:hypothetical protein